MYSRREDALFTDEQRHTSIADTENKTGLTTKIILKRLIHLKTRENYHAY
ncbi:hypothetical protein UYSO10_2067 [Kosakonia radicincitans]|nr:hypothetical protein UYSO10_2067 [Kosakonia radicincitans]